MNTNTSELARINSRLAGAAEAARRCSNRLACAASLDSLDAAHVADDITGLGAEMQALAVRIRQAAMGRDTKTADYARDDHEA
ncbi:MAG TPA: hypothetical protein VGN52_01050 [Burkholderiales bacterium]|jgi:hypothetical protein